jgi:hypothetical protein
VSDAATRPMPIQKLALPLKHMRVAATYEADPPSWLGGLIEGFLTESEAASAFGSAIPGGKPLSSVLPGGAGNCSAGDDRDVVDGESGWWFYFKFIAERVVYDTGAPLCAASDVKLTVDCPAGTVSAFENQTCNDYFACQVGSYCSSVVGGGTGTCTSCVEYNEESFASAPAGFCVPVANAANLADACQAISLDPASGFPECAIPCDASATDLAVVCPPGEVSLLADPTCQDWYRCRVQSNCNSEIGSGDGTCAQCLASSQEAFASAAQYVCVPSSLAGHLAEICRNDSRDPANGFPECAIQ